jgi:hypothetical protein
VDSASSFQPMADPYKEAKRRAESVRWKIAPGSQEMWWCQTCGEVLNRPPRTIDGERYHSWKCQRPMRRVRLDLRLIDGRGGGG